MIDFFIIQNKTKVPLIYSTSNKDDRGIAYRPCLESLERQAKELGITINIKLVELNEVPTSTKSLLVGFLCENNLIPDDYLGRVLSLNNLYRSNSFPPICGTLKFSRPCKVLNFNNSSLKILDLSLSSSSCDFLLLSKAIIYFNLNNFLLITYIYSSTIMIRK